MAKRKKAKISLARSALSDAVATTSPASDGGAKDAKALLRRFAREGYRAPQAPSPERIMRARGTARIERFSEVVEVARGDKFEPAAVDFVRMRVDDGPLSRLRDRNQLDKTDRLANLALARAGEMYRDSFFRAGLDPLRALDPTQEIAGGRGGPVGLWRSEAQAQALRKFRAARDAIPEDFRAALEAIVLADRELVDIGRQIGAYRDAKMAGAVALFILRRGLAALARHYGVIGQRQRAP